MHEQYKNNTSMGKNNANVESLSEQLTGTKSKQSAGLSDQRSGSKSTQSEGLTDQITGGCFPVFLFFLFSGITVTVAIVHYML